MNGKHPALSPDQSVHKLKQMGASLPTRDAEKEVAVRHASHQEDHGVNQTA